MLHTAPTKRNVVYRSLVSVDKIESTALMKSWEPTCLPSSRTSEEPSNTGSLKQSELNCIVREYGAPTLFLTFSCAEYESADIVEYLKKVNGIPLDQKVNSGKLCTQDPVSVTRQFSHKFNSFFRTMIQKCKVLGEVEHFYWKREYQARGAPHFHVLLWIKDAPLISRDSPEKDLLWIQ